MTEEDMNARAIIGYLKPSVEFINSDLSKRELFAAMAMQCLMLSTSSRLSINVTCKLAVKYADALLKELNDGEKD